jgi:hypothetical protein
MTRAEHLAQRMPLSRLLMAEHKLGQDTVLFDIQVAADLVDQRRGLGVDSLTDLGPIRLPYPSMLMEWDESCLREIDSQDIKLIGHDHGYVHSAMAFWLEEAEEGEGFWMMPMVVRSIDNAIVTPGLSLGVETTGGIITRLRPQIAIGVIHDRDAGATHITFADPGTEADVFNGTAQEFEEACTATAAYAQSVLMALSLINCRNVATPALGKLTARRSGTQKRRGFKPFEVRYHTIELPGGGSQRVGSGTRAHDRATALHRVKGHFKHFGPDYGTEKLFGKYEGKYWWGWQLRGNPELGIIESDYKIKGQAS